MIHDTSSLQDNFAAGHNSFGTGPAGGSGDECQTDVLVVGGGPTGLMMASELLRHGVRMRCIDKLLEPQHFSKASGVWPRSVEIFDQKGIAERFIDKSIQAKKFVIYDHQKRPLLDLDVAALQTKYPFLMGIEQYTTEALLTEHLEELGGRVERGVTLQSFEEVADGMVATLSHVDGRIEHLKCRYLAGCGGAHSTIRHALGLEFSGEKYPCDYLLGHMQVEWDLPDEQLYVFFSEHGSVFAAPLPNNRWLLVGELAGDQKAICHDGAPTLEELHQVFAPRIPSEIRLSNPQWTSFFAVHHRMVKQYRHGRAFLSGDAGHIHSPVGGQGMNTGMQDAHNLAWKLAYVCHGWASDALLDSYHAERHPVAEHVLGLTDRIQKSINLRGAAKMKARNLVMGAVGRLEFVRSNAVVDMSETAYTYKQGPLASECRHTSLWPSGDNQHPGMRDGCCFRSGPKAGDRAPEVELTDSPVAWLSHVWRSPKVVMLLFAGMHDEASSEVRANFEQAADFARQAGWENWIEPWCVVRNEADAQAVADLGFSVIQDQSAELHQRYGAASACTYLIRPDGHILCRTQPIDLAWVESFLVQAGFQTAGAVATQDA